MHNRDGLGAAQTLYEEGRFSELIALLEPRITAGIDAQSAVTLARAYGRVGRSADAINVYGAICRAAPAAHDVHIEAGLFAHGAGEHARAEMWLKAAVAAGPERPEAHYYLGVVQAAKGDPNHQEQAFESFGTAARLRPDWLEAWFRRAQMGYNNAHVEDAVEALDRCLAINPQYADAWYLRFTCLADLGRTEEALACLRGFVEMRPEHEAASRELRRYDAMLGEKRRSISRFPKNVQLFQDARRILNEYVLPEVDGIEPFLRPSSIVLTTGSCFARNITLSLKNIGIAAHHVEQLEDISSTYANRYFFEWLAGYSNPYAEAFAQAFPADEAANLRELLRAADAVVFSLGVAPCFFERGSGKFVLTLGVNHSIALQSDTAEFRTTTVQENVANLQRIDQIIAGLNPDVRFVLTLSPVPLKATFGHGSAIVADCLSKSTLRVAAQEFLASTELSSFYWPSFEMVRWFGGYAPYPVFGKEDGNPRHVNADLVDDILTCFIDRFGTPALRQRLQEPAKL